MIIKKYRANTIEEARALVLQELGPEAIILTTNYIKENGLKALFSTTKVEITAAIEEQELKAYQKAMAEQPTLTTLEPPTVKTAEEEGLEKIVSSATEINEPSMDLLSLSPAARQRQKELQDQIANALSPKIEKKLNPLSSLEQETKNTQELAEKASTDDLLKPSKNLVLQFGHLTKLKLQDTVHASFHTSIIEEEKREVFETAASNTAACVSPLPDLVILRELVREEISKAQQSIALHPENSSSTLHFLLSKGLKRSLALGIEQKIKAEFGSENLDQSSYERTLQINMLKNELAKLIMTTGPIILQKNCPTIVVLVGSTGVGKTTTLAKLAVQYAKENKQVGLISMDHTKAHAAEQLQNATRFQTISTKLLIDPKNLPEALQNLDDKEIIFIDTPGINQYKWTHMQEILQQFNTIRDVQVYLTLSATTKDVDAYSIVQQCSSIPIVGLIFTKLDETINYGILMNVCQTKQIPISYLTTGPEIQRDLIIADGQDLARRFLVKHNEQELQQLRDIAIG